jgi:hypothetical protein
MTSSLTPPTDTPSDSRPCRTPAQLADEAAEAIRSLNHATLFPGAGYEYASDVYDAIGSLRVLAERLPQALTQAAKWLATAESHGWLQDVEATSARATRRTVGIAVTQLTTSAGYAASMASDLSHAQSAAGRLATDSALDEPIPFLPVDREAPR